MTDLAVERPEIINALRVAHDEIINLRRELAEVRPKAHAYDTIAQLAQLSVHREPQGYGEDAAWRVKQMVERLIAEREAERETSHD